MQSAKQKKTLGLPESLPIGKTKKKQDASLGQRWLTALLLIPCVLLFVWFGGWASFAAILLVLVLGTFELQHMFVNAGYHPLVWVSLGLGVFFLCSAMFPHQSLLILQVSLGVFLLVSFSLLFLRRTLDGVLADLSFTLMSPIYLGWPLSFFLFLRGYEVGQWHLNGGIWLFLPRGGWWLLTTLLAVWAFDGAAFFAGRYFGRHKLAPLISPAKTWEGVAGGLVSCIIACLVLTVIPLGVPWYLAVVLGLLVGTAATLGDLAESMIKRQMHVKDSGQIMPGHGGMLDRLDSILFAVIVVYMFAQLVGR